jgi:hypothetical protein
VHGNIRSAAMQTMLTEENLSNLFRYSKDFLGYFTTGFAGFNNFSDAIVGNHDCRHM